VAAAARAPRQILHRLPSERPVHAGGTALHLVPPPPSGYAPWCMLHWAAPAQRAPRQGDSQSMLAANVLAVRVSWAVTADSELPPDSRHLALEEEDEEVTTKKISMTSRVLLYNF